MNDYQVMCEGQSPLDDDVAKRAARVLMLKYPVQSPHMWKVSVRDNAIWLKSSMTGNACMVRHLSKIDFSSSEFERQIEFAAGELLERAKLSNSTEQDYAKTLDGGDAFKWKPTVVV